MGTSIAGKVLGNRLVVEDPHNEKLSLAHLFREGDGHPNLCSHSIIFKLFLIWLISFSCIHFSPTGSSVDTQPPTVLCPSNQHQSVSTGSTGVNVTYPAAHASDTSGQPVTLSYSHPSGNFFSVGHTNVTVTATDATGNQAKCYFTVSGKSGQGLSVI